MKVKIFVTFQYLLKTLKYKNLINIKNLIKHHLFQLCYSMSTISSFKRIENKYDIYIYEDCIKSLCEFLRKHGMKTNNFKKKSMKLLTKEHQESYEKVKTLLYL